MPEPARTDGGRPPWLWLLVSLAVVVADQLTKQLVVRQFELYERLVITPFFDIVRLHNTGAAFSLLADRDGWQNSLFAGLAVVISLVLLWWLRRLPAGLVVAPLGLTLVLGGALGNLIDRLVYGHVVDFLLVHYEGWSWPAFNIADSAISCGVVLLLLDGLFLEKRRQQPA